LGHDSPLGATLDEMSLPKIHREIMTEIPRGNPSIIFHSVKHLHEWMIHEDFHGDFHHDWNPFMKSIHDSFNLTVLAPRHKKFQLQ